MPVGEYDLIVSIGQSGFEQHIPVVDGDCINTVGSWTRKIAYRSLLDGPLSGTEKDVMIVQEIPVIQILDGDICLDAVVLRQVDYILDDASL